MRIVAGTHRGRSIRAPRGWDTRPTADRVRESLFGRLGPLDGVEVLDLFAGSGALGMEALSRGAAQAVLVDSAPAAVAAIRANAASLGLEDRCRIVRADWRPALRRLRGEGLRVGLCLLDPPYSLLPRIAEALGPALAPVLAAGASVVIEHDADVAGELPGLPPAVADRRVHGDTAVTILRLE